MKLALFDFDGTITNKDTLFEFIKFAKGKLTFYAGFIVLLPVLILFKAGLISNQKAKEIVLSFFFKGMDAKAFKEITREFSITIVPHLIRPLALEKIKWHIAESHKVIIVSASVEDWIKPWANTFNIDVISSKLEVINNKVTGKLSGKNCNAEEKVELIKCSLCLSDFNYIYAYGDSKGDLAMLELANEKNYKPFLDLA